MHDQAVVSVVMPVYNRAAYVGAAIESVLAQTYRPIQLIVVDDGSMDESAEIIRTFGDAIHPIFQENQGVSAARNVGLSAATGAYIAFLDSDDMWEPSFAETMVAAANSRPDAAVFYSRGRAMDATGAMLPQSVSAHRVAPEAMYATLLRKNFLIPSAMLLRREALDDVAWFDSAFTVGEDWDLWLRLLQRGVRFVAVTQSLMRYRVHEGSLTGNVAVGRQSMSAVAAKLFGSDDGYYAQWPWDKRQIYGGVYIYYLLTALVQQGDWVACGDYLQRALAIDTAIATDLDLFYELALGDQPVGRRTPAAVRAALPQHVVAVERLLANLQASAVLPPSTYRKTLGTAYYALGLLAYNAGELALSRRLNVRALRYRPKLATDKLLAANLIKSLLGPAALGKLRQRRA
jgi:glycosyltransferase involved in cell wall biosynthesis